MTDIGALMQTEEEEVAEDSSPAMTTSYYSSALSGHLMRGGNDESSFELGLGNATVDSNGTSFPPQALAYDNQYMGAYPPVGWYAVPLPPTYYNYHHHPTAHQSMYPTYPVQPVYGPSAPAAQYQHLQYPSNDTSPPRQGRVKASFSNEDDEDLKLTLTGDRQRDLRSVLYYVRKNPSATLFDIDGKWCSLFPLLLSLSINLVALRFRPINLRFYHRGSQS